MSNPLLIGLTFVNLFLLLAWIHYAGGSTATVRKPCECICDCGDKKKDDGLLPSAPVTTVPSIRELLPKEPVPVLNPSLQPAAETPSNTSVQLYRGPTQSIADDTRIFKKLAHRCTDKTTTHRYHHLYPTVLHKYRHVAENAAAKGIPVPKLKLLEMGLGCDMGACVAGGMRLLRSYLPDVEYHVFEYNMKLCRQRYTTSSLKQADIDYLESHLCEGSSADPAALQQCGDKFGPFDIIIDDASHQLDHIYAAFNYWYPSKYLRPGGAYIIEDLQVSFAPGYLNGKKIEQSMATHISDILRWKLNLNPNSAGLSGPVKPASLNPNAPHLSWLTKSIFCVAEACAFEKIVGHNKYPVGFPHAWRV